MSDEVLWVYLIPTEQHEREATRKSDTGGEGMASEWE